MLHACLVIFEGGLRPPSFNNLGVLVCVVNWMLLLPLNATLAQVYELFFYENCRIRLSSQISEIWLLQLLDGAR